MAVIVLLLTKNQQMEKAFSKLHLGAFFASQKNGLCGGSAACAAAPRPSNPLRTNRPVNPQCGFTTDPNNRHITTVVELIPFG
jgi:hypothetical protein